MAEEFDHPFGEPTPGEAVKPTFFNPTAGYRPRGKYIPKAYGSGYIRIDAGEFETEQPMTPTTAIAERPVEAMPKDQIDLIRRTVANGATNDELSLFLYDCQRRGIHPLDKLLHFTKRGGKYTPVTSIDFMRSQAAASGEMAGSEDAVFSENDTRESWHPVSATVTVYRMTAGARFPYTATARWSEYCPDNAQMWRKMPHTMLGKCAEALALRKAFPQQLAGLYSSEEMDQASPREVAQSVERASEKREVAGSTPALPATSSVAQFDPKQQATDGLGNKFPATDDGPNLGTAEPDDLPDGFRLIDDYKLDGDWHHVTWGRDAAGGWMVYKTKLAKVGLAAHNAFTEKMPVMLHSNKFPYLDKVEKLGITRQQIDDSRWRDDA